MLQSYFYDPEAAITICWDFANGVIFEYICMLWQKK